MFGRTTVASPVVHDRRQVRALWRASYGADVQNNFHSGEVNQKSFSHQQEYGPGNDIPTSPTWQRSAYVPGWNESSAPRACLPAASTTIKTPGLLDNPASTGSFIAWCGSASQELSNLLRPTVVDLVTIAGAFMLPAGNPRLKTALISGGLGLGRLVNMNNQWSLATAGILGFCILASRLAANQKRLFLAADVGTWMVSRAIHDIQAHERAIHEGVSGLLHGTHDLKSCLNGLETYYRCDQAGYLTLVRRVNENIALSLHSGSTASLAQQFRDTTLLSLAVADCKLNQQDGDAASAAFFGATNAVPGGPPRQYSVPEALGAALQLDPGYPDLPRLSQMSKEVAGRLEGFKTTTFSRGPRI